MPYNDDLHIRISSEDLAFLDKIAKYRFSQGLLRAPTVSEYIRYVWNKDMSEAFEEIKSRRK